MSKTTMKVHVGTLADMGARFADAWKRAQAGKLRRAEHHLTLPSLDALLALLSRRRLELLRALHTSGPSSVRALAKTLHRDYKNVHTDVGALEQSALIERDQQGRVFTPWASIGAELELAA